MTNSQLKINIFNLFNKALGLNLSKKLLFKLNKKYIISQKIIFIHIPKAAGTSIASIIYGKRIGHFTYKEYKRFLNKDIDKEFTIFSVVRNPYSRLISAYNYAVQGGTNEGGINNPKLYKTKAFRTFESFIKEWLVFQDLNKVELVFRPQYLFLNCEDNTRSLRVDKILKLEDINSINLYLSEITRDDVVLERKNSSEKRESYEDLGNDLKVIIYKLYQDDFELLNYQK